MSGDRAAKVERWLVSLAQDVIEHDCCSGCQWNAAQALAEIGRLDEVLTLTGKPDPRREADDAARPEADTAYRSDLSIALDNGTVLRDDEASGYLRAHHHSDDERDNSA
jgi:hypothetical protein